MTRGEVDTEELERGMEDWRKKQIMFSKTCALTGDNVTSSFHKMVVRMFNLHKKNQLEELGENKSMRLTSNMVSRTASQNQSRLKKGEKKEDDDNEQQSCKGGCC